jgi:small conductance mechanosensitive channel
VFIPNRTILNVVNYPQGYIRAFLDMRLPEDATLADQAEDRVRTMVSAFYEQFPGILLVPPTVVGREVTSAGSAYLRGKFRIWPGQGGVLETFARQNIIQALRQLDDTYADWMVAVYYRAEPKSADPSRSLPRPAALRRL